MAKSGGTEKGIKTPAETSGFRMGKNYLLAIGINEYKYCPPLSNCVQDARAFVELLQNRYYFESEHTIALYDKEATRRSILQELENLKNKVRKPDCLVIYFSGHGELLNNAGFWVPIEADPKYTADFISTNDIISRLDMVDSLHTFLIADACFSGSLFIKRKVVKPQNDFTRPSRLGLSSSHSREAALDGQPGDNSPFASCLIQELLRNTEPLNAARLADAVSKEVQRRTKAKQSPIFRPLDVKGDDLGTFVFYPRKDESTDRKEVEMPEHQYSCLYDSQSDKTGNKWTLFNDAGLSTHPSSIVLSKEGKDGMIFKLKATGKEFVGINIPISRLVGIIELEYLAIGAKNGGLENLIFFIIPMKHNSLNQTGYIEVGSDVQDFHKNPFSPFRKRFVIPKEQVGDQTWHRIQVEFDFREINDAFYSMFSPRINEGASEKGQGEIQFKNVKIFG